MSSNAGLIQPLTKELAALDHIENDVTIVSRILIKLSGNEDMHNILDEFEFHPDNMLRSYVSLNV